MHRQVVAQGFRGGERLLSLVHVHTRQDQWRDGSDEESPPHEIHGHLAPMQTVPRLPEEGYTAPYRQEAQGDEGVKYQAPADELQKQGEGYQSQKSADPGADNRDGEGLGPLALREGVCQDSVGVGADECCSNAL